MELPDSMFADGEEPVGVRVLTYQSSRSINNILNAVHEDEIQYLRSTPFGKIVEIAEKPAFSGRFTRFMLSRQLKVEKNPRGLIPSRPKMKKKRTLKDKTYWPELFGTVEDLSVCRAVKMLQKNTVTDKDLRIKLACLAILSSVLLSTNLKMKMLKEYSELLGDLDDFFAFPWGRLAFDMLMSSIKRRDVVSLSQDTIELKGFALALQLVIVEAVPSLTKVVQEASSSSDSDSEEEEIEGMIYKPKKSIIPYDPSRPLDESVLTWSDEVHDVKVDNLMKLISLNHVFTKEMFRGGATKIDVQRMREKPKTEGRKKRSIQKEKSSIVVDESRIIAIVSVLLKPELERVDGTVASAIASVREVASSALSYQANVVSSVESMLKAFKDDIVTSVQNATSKAGVETTPTTPRPAPTAEGKTSANHAVSGLDANDAIIVNVLDNISHYSTPPRSADQSPVFDILMRLVRSTCYTHASCSGATKPEFLDSRFVSMLCRNYKRFRKSKTKDSYVFPKGLVDCAVKSCSSGNASTRFYLPLHVEKKHWLGLCVDFKAAKIYVLDCNSGGRSDSELSQDLLPISDMFPYLLTFCGLLEVLHNNPLRPERIKGVVQNNNSADAALTAALLMQTHALFGVETCRCITPAVINDEAHRAAVML
ncbi:hypothetical protein N665_0974s0001 [Sinapis alba]|nr:hypothetical protein N665_0974s0001 [Sinapis alba]